MEMNEGVGSRQRVVSAAIWILLFQRKQNRFSNRKAKLSSDIGFPVDGRVLVNVVKRRLLIGRRQHRFHADVIIHFLRPMKNRRTLNP